MSFASFGALGVVSFYESYLLDADIVGHAFESGAGGVMLIEGTTDEALTSQSKDLYSWLKKETKAFKLPIRYSHCGAGQRQSPTGF